MHHWYVNVSLPPDPPEPCGFFDAGCWNHPVWWWLSPYQICERCVAQLSEWGPKTHTCRRPLDTLIDGAPVTPNTWIHTASSKTRFGADLSLASKKTVPSRPNLGMRIMIPFFFTNKTNPSSFRMPLLLKNNWKETVCVEARLTLKSCCFELALPVCGRPQKLFVHTGPFYVCSWGCWKGQTACVCPSNLGRWYLLR